ncbi:MAG: tetraacyldisaccharide 4'-kinase [Paracoccaceae bacterium]|nr:tetraacyldisaccharide 4'-kinase [Paracoccaceae bacterium]
MRPPAFWQNPPERPGWQARALAPLSLLYELGTARRLKKGPAFKPRVPVISVGNLNVGGTGKTPTVIALADGLSDRTPHVVLRGYGGSEPGPLRVDPTRHDAEQVGDEALLLAAFAPTWISQDRAAGVALAEDAGAGVILLDDAHQNPSVPKTLSIVVVDAEVGFGNARVLPAGPLREPVDVGLKRADLLLSIGDERAQQSFAASLGHHLQLPHATATLELLETGMDWSGLKVLAFAGIGRPEKFFRTVRQTGAELLRAEALDDHQPLTEALMKRLELEAQTLGAQLVTTEKDAVRLPPSFRTKVLALPVRLQFTDMAGLDTLLEKLP